MIFCRLFVALAFVHAAAPVAAQTVSYLCEMKPEPSGYIQPMIGIGFDPETRSAFAFDAIIAQQNQTALKAYLAENTAEKSIVAWRVLFRNSWGQTAHIGFRAAITKKTGRVFVSAKPAGYVDSYSSQGKCTLSDMQIPGIN